MYNRNKIYITIKFSISIKNDEFCQSSCIFLTINKNNKKSAIFLIHNLTMLKFEKEKNGLKFKLNNRIIFLAY